jgi:tetratricopeptide (TPR) repeat protein
MRLRPLFACLTVALLASPAAFAMPGGGGKDKSDEPPSSNPAVPTENQEAATGPRHEAEQSYALAYEEIAKAKKDLEKGKAKNAEKKFRRALERVENAVALDERYYEAWNLVGYTARKLDDYDRAFAAYEKCLAIKFDYAPAHEYLGEAWLEQKNPAKAQEQLVILERINPDSEESRTLRAAVQAYEAANGHVATPDSASMPVDSTRAETSEK